MSTLRLIGIVSSQILCRIGLSSTPGQYNSAQFLYRIGVVTENFLWWYITKRYEIIQYIVSVWASYCYKNHDEFYFLTKKHIFLKQGSILWKVRQKVRQNCNDEQSMAVAHTLSRTIYIWDGMSVIRAYFEILMKRRFFVRQTFLSK